MTDKINFDRPNFPVKLPDDGAPEYLMILLHGYGASGNDLIGLSDIFDQIIPQTVYLSPHAPHQTPFGGHQWFPLSDLSSRELETGTISIAPYVHNFIDQALAYYKIKPEKLIIAGFSQGSMISMHVSMEREIAPAAILAYSGALTAVDGIEERIKSKPPILICHGGDDPVVLPSYTSKATETLKNLGFEAEGYIYPGYLHTIPPEALRESLSFLNKHLKL